MKLPVKLIRNLLRTRHISVCNYCSAQKSKPDLNVSYFNQEKTNDLVNTVEEPVLIETVGEKRNFNFAPRRFEVVASKSLGMLKTDSHLGILAGERSYYLRDDLALLEQALIRYTIDRLKKLNFTPVSVPDILKAEDVESCGFDTRSQRTQVYHLKNKWNPDNYCLSGTSEMALASLYKSNTIQQTDLPIRLMSVSRCHRAEVSTLKEEKGMYRVHQFTKVEMFGLTKGSLEHSERLHNEFLDIQKNLFKDIGIHFLVKDMQACDLGPSAHRKFDIEAWMPGHKKYGEISSTSNCTDYQSKRLNITYMAEGNSGVRHVHTVNGTACAVPRMLIAILENFLNEDDSVLVPEVLQPYMNCKKLLTHTSKHESWRWLPYYYLENKLD